MAEPAKKEKNQRRLFAGVPVFGLLAVHGGDNADWFAAQSHDLPNCYFACCSVSDGQKRVGV